MKKNMLVVVAIFFYNLDLWAQSPNANESQDYNEFKDKNIEFSLDDGENESRFHFEDQNLIEKRMKELETKKAIRKEQMNAQIKKEEELNDKLAMMALQEKNKKIHELRLHKIALLKLQQDKINALFALNHFHQFPQAPLIPFVNNAPKNQRIDGPLIPSRKLASANPSSITSLSGKAPQIPSTKIDLNKQRTPATDKNWHFKGLLQRAKNKIFDYFKRFKSFF